MGPTGATCRVLQLHPTRRCNLQCRHCYSSSGPEERDELGIALLCDALTDARAEGYTVAGFSGGEPMLYKHLRTALEHARSCGFSTTVTSNGMLLDERRLDALRGAVCLLAISLDGVPASHDRMRGSPRAFSTMASRLQGVRQSGIPFGFIFTLTQHNVHELDWVAQFAIEQGAKLLQIHPLEIVGRARTELPASRPDEIEAAFAYLEAARIQQMAGDRLSVQVDLTDRELLEQQPARALAEQSDQPPGARLADLVSPLVIEPDGEVVPIQHGFARRYTLGNLHGTRLRDMATEWRRARYQEFRDLCRSVFSDVTKPKPLPFFNWYEAIGQAAEQPAPV